MSSKHKGRYKRVNKGQHKLVEKFHSLIKRGNKAEVTPWLEVNKVTPMTYYKDASKRLSSSDFRAVGLAAYNGHCELVRSLITLGFNLQELAFHSGFPECTPTHLACERGHVDVVRMLVEEFGVDVNMDVSFSPLRWAARHGQLEVVRYLADAGAELDSKEECPIFQDAADKNFPEVLNFLIERTPEVYTKPEYDYTPLHIAACAGFVSTARALLDTGGDVNVTDYGHDTPFLVAVPHGKLDMMKFLIWRNADPDIVDIFGNTALHQALVFRHFDIAHYLIRELNISPSTKNSSGETPLACLLKHCRDKDEDVINMVELIVSAGHQPVEVFNSIYDDDDEHDDDDDRGASDEWEEKMNQLKYITSNPRTLQKLCVLKIRQITRKKLLSFVESVSISQIIKNVILLHDTRGFI